MALMSGQPFPPPKAANPTVTPAPTPVVSNPVGAAVGDGYYDNAAPTVYTTAGETYTAAMGPVCVLFSINSIFGPNNYWTVKTPAPAAPDMHKWILLGVALATGVHAQTVSFSPQVSLGKRSPCGRRTSAGPSRTSRRRKSGRWLPPTGWGTSRIRRLRNWWPRPPVRAGVEDPARLHGCCGRCGHRSLYQGPGQFRYQPGSHGNRCGRDHGGRGLRPAVTHAAKRRGVSGAEPCLNGDGHYDRRQRFGLGPVLGSRVGRGGVYGQSALEVREGVAGELATNQNSSERAYRQPP